MSCVQMSFYAVNDYVVLRREAAAARLLKGGPYTTEISGKMSAYRVRANSHEVRVFNFQQGIVEVKTGQSNVNPNKGATYS